MKLYKIILTAVLGALALTGCDDEKMQWGKPDGHGDVNISDIPLNIAEQLANYDFIKKYAAEYMPGVTIGLGLDAGFYMDDAEYKQVADDNFQMYTMGNAMKHSSVVGANGNFNFATIDKFFATIPADMPVYGHNFIWHTQQRASYLNGLIAPEVIPQPGGTNLLTNGDFEDGFTGWSAWGDGLTSSEVTSDESLTGSHSLKVVASSTSSQLHYIQVEAPSVPLIVGHQYEISFWVKSEGDGGIRLSFSDTNQMSEQYPWHKVEGQYATTSGTWKEVKYSTETVYNASNAPFVAVGNSMKFRLDMGQFPGIVYYIDNVIVRDLDATDPGESNIISNGGFETSDLTNWNANNAGAGITVVDSEKTEGNYAAKLVASSTSSGDWNLQLQSDAITLTAGDDYTLSFYIKSDVSGKGRISFPGFKEEYPYMDWTGTGQGARDFDTSASWMQISVDFKAEYADGKNSVKISFDLGQLPDVTYYVDDVKLIEKTPVGRASISRSGPIIIEKPDAEKKQIITDAMEAWIKGMLDHCKDRVKMWDVLNEPIGDNLQLRGVDFVPSTVGDQEFYWGQYMGKEYGVKAFQFARQYGNPEDLLFINDYGLETNLNKLAKLIEYTNYIDQTNGSPIVDGIGTQMHVMSSITREQVDAMFKAMAATGKLVRITELDVRVESPNPTAAQLEQQAKVYQMIVESFKANVPAAQQSGITVWTLTDAVREHEYWLPDDAPNLFDANYGRKYAYKGFCDGIAGRNIGDDFTGDDWKNAYPPEEGEE